MSRALLFLLAGVAFLSSAVAADRPVGKWLFYKKIYRGMEMPEPPEATLRLHFEFAEDGSSRLYWWHEGEGDRCERAGRYTLDGNVIVEEATWVNPKNHPDCARDPDMQTGKVTRTPYEIRGGDLWLTLPFSDESLIYVWRKLRLSGEGI